MILSFTWCFSFTEKSYRRASTSALRVDWLSFSCCESDRLWRERNESWQVNKEVCHLWHFIQIICSCQSFSWWKTPQYFTIFYILISLWFLFCGFHLLYMSFTPWWKLRLCDFVWTYVNHPATVLISISSQSRANLLTENTQLHWFLFSIW